jgi:hypothetical protein
MLGRTAPPIVPSPGFADRLRALFDEAWRRARRRRLLVAATLIAAVVVAVAVAQSTGDRSIPVAPPPAALALPRDPGMGVACPEANSIACDRIGIAVWLDSDPQRLVARVGGRSVALRDAHIRCAADRSCPRLYQAMLQPAGLLDGALKVTPDEGRYRWLGQHPVEGTLTITATYRDGSRAVATRRVPLAPGWG